MKKVPKRIMQAIEDMLKAHPDRFVVILKGYGNPDHDQYADVSNLMLASAPSLEAIATICMGYISEWNLGGGNWGAISGNVYCVMDVSKPTAQISYVGEILEGHSHWRDVVRMPAERTTMTVQDYAIATLKSQLPSKSPAK